MNVDTITDKDDSNDKDEVKDKDNDKDKVKDNMTDENIIEDKKEEIQINDHESDKIIVIEKTILVLSGGGIKGLALIGCLKALEKLNMLSKFTTLAGTSVGALIIALFIIGYTPDELYVFIKKFNFGDLKNIKVLNIFSAFGIDDGCKMQVMIEKMIEAKGWKTNITLNELYQATNKTIIMTTTCLNTVKAEYLSHETHPNMSLSLAIRMSTCIPWFYVPISYQGKLYVDGGCIDNYPIHLFKKRIEEVVGIYLIDSYGDNEIINNLEAFSVQVFKCFMQGVAFNAIKGYESETINVNLKNINAVDYDLDVIKKRKLCIIGLQSVQNYFHKNPIAL